MAPSEAVSWPRVLHVEVGGTYGGSLRALEVYLKYADTSRLRHDLLIYFPTPGMQTVAGLAERCWTLRERTPCWLARPRPKAREGGTGAPAFARRSLAAELKELAATLCRRLPLLPSVITCMRRGHYQVIHVNNTFTYQPEAVLAARLLKIPVVAHVRNPIPRSRLAQYLLRLIDQVVVVSRAEADSLRSWHSHVYVVTIHDGAEIPRIDPARAAALRRRWLPSEGLLVGSVGRLHPQKGYSIFLRAARLVLDSWRWSVPLKFVIAGEGAQRVELEDIIRNLELEGHLMLCGFIPEIADFIASLDVLACSSLWEGGPLVVVEAAQLGVPVVATSVGVVPELLSEYGVAPPVPPGDPKALADAILSVLQWRLETPSAERERQLEKLKAVAAQLYDPSQNAQRLDEVLWSATARAHPHRRPSARW